MKHFTKKYGWGKRGKTGEAVMIKLKTGDYVDAKCITGIRIGKRVEKELSSCSMPPRVIVDYNGYNIVVPFETLEEAKSYADKLHGEIADELETEASCKKSRRFTWSPL